MPGPMPPQGAPPQGGPPQDPQAGGGPQGHPAGKLLESVSQAIDQISQNIMQDKSAPPRAKQLAQSIDQQWGELMDMIMGNGPGEDSDDSSAQGQTVPPEAGGNPGAKPSPF
jgi:hypothetical protein